LCSLASHATTPKMTGSTFAASEIQAFFPDGKQVNYTTDDINSIKSPRGGDAIVLKQGETKEIRLYLTTPEQDWRCNLTYSWQLSMARMHAAAEYNDNETGWYYWNVENNVNSQIKGFSSSPLFSAESVTLHFKAFSRAPRSQPLQGTLIMKHVKLGAQLNENITDLQVFRPCQSPFCEIVDGVATGESQANTFASEAIQLAEELPMYAVALTVLIPFFLFCVSIWCIQRRIKSTQEYVPIEEDTAEEYVGDEAGDTIDDEDDAIAANIEL
jgi:hypothetical protein